MDELIEATLQRTFTGDEGTFGFIIAPGQAPLDTAELPWRSNIQNISCIPAGSYTCDLAYSPHFGVPVYHVRNVPGRGDVEIHKGNWAGDKACGYKSDVLGCIILGMGVGEVEGQKGLTNSADAFNIFMTWFDDKPFKLTILDVPGENA